jgi:hypothetical protein
VFVAAKVVPAFPRPGADRPPRSDRRPPLALPALYVAEAAVFATLALLTGAFWLPAILGLAVVDGTLALTAADCPVPPPPRCCSRPGS